MTESSDNPVEMATVVAALKFAGRRLEVTMSLPAGPIPPADILPLARSLADAIAEAAMEFCEENGRPVSCGPGCGVCCRQLVPVSALEARALVRLVEEMPGPRRSAVRSRFAEARRRLGEAGLLGKLLNPGPLKAEQLRPLGEAYHDLGICCPFLENESCSIYPDRPCVCREYMVVSPPGNCARPTPMGVKCVMLPGKVSVTLNFLTGGESDSFGQWVPLAVVPAWVDAHRDQPAPRSGTELLRELLNRLAGEALPFPPLGLSDAPGG